MACVFYFSSKMSATTISEEQYDPLSSFDSSSVGVAPPLSTIEGPPTNKAKTSINACQTVNSEILSVLMASHTNHYAAWSKGRTKSGRQLLPAEVWTKVVKRLIVKGLFYVIKDFIFRSTTITSSFFHNARSARSS